MSHALREQVLLGEGVFLLLKGFGSPKLSPRRPPKVIISGFSCLLWVVSCFGKSSFSLATSPHPPRLGGRRPEANRPLWPRGAPESPLSLDGKRVKKKTKNKTLMLQVLSPVAHQKARVGSKL